MAVLLKEGIGTAFGTCRVCYKTEQYGLDVRGAFICQPCIKYLDQLAAQEKPQGEVDVDGYAPRKLTGGERDEKTLLTLPNPTKKLTDRAQVAANAGAYGE